MFRLPYKRGVLYMRYRNFSVILGGIGSLDSYQNEVRVNPAQVASLKGQVAPHL